MKNNGCCNISHVSTNHPFSYQTFWEILINIFCLFDISTYIPTKNIATINYFSYMKFSCSPMMTMVTRIKTTIITVIMAKNGHDVDNSDERDKDDDRHHYHNHDPDDDGNHDDDHYDHDHQNYDDEIMSDHARTSQRKP